MRKLRTQEEIISKWKGDLDKPLVSICCITYNHEPYIEDAIEGFLIQETDFPFEILIHDDASTDKTADIIREYEAKYPKLIKPIYQTENQYSKGVKPGFINYKRALGEYIALCEGDDYWIDSRKLQIQINKMKEYPDCHISFHPAYTIDYNTKQKQLMSFYSKQATIFKLPKVIEGDGGFMPTASLVLKKEAVLSIPEYIVKNAPVVDYFLQIFGSVNGGALFLPNIMSLYRLNLPGSWNTKQKNIENRLFFMEKMIEAFTFLDSYFNFKYSKILKLKIRQYRFGILRNYNYLIEDREKFFKDNYSFFNLKEKLLWKLVFSKPRVYEFLKKISLRERLK